MATSDKLKYFIVSPSHIFRLKNKVFDGSPMFRNMFNDMDPDGYEETSELAEADIVVWTGGPDVSPHLYGRRVHHKTQFNVQRDIKDILAWSFSGRAKIRLGVGRGAQFLNVMNGGDIFQDLAEESPSRSHMNEHKVFRYTTEDIDDPDSKIMETHEYTVSSLHHQMMKPSKKGIILGHAVRDDYGSHSLCTVKYHGQTLGQHRGPSTVYVPREGAWEEDLIDPEMIYYPETRSLCVQGRPEFSNKRLDEFRQDLHRMIQEIITKCAA